ncbi:hypothetical protein [Streptomyces cucumeris]|uniref:hypothetical protein n=1 Tax=Streptomyces cucumeris TaxID=2962890 RepID=UPI003D7473DD
MNIGKKVFLGAAAGALIIGSAASASAYGNSSLTRASHCDTTVGDVATVGGVAPTGDVNIGAECVSTGSADLQANQCDTTTGVIAPVGVAAPTGDINIGSKCANLAGDRLLHH